MQLTLLFSATMPNDIAKLAHEILKNLEKVEIALQGPRVDHHEHARSAARRIKRP
jgi:superfamily II DNA/RNA helicase